MWAEISFRKRASFGLSFSPSQRHALITFIMGGCEKFSEESETEPAPLSQLWMLCGAGTKPVMLKGTLAPRATGPELWPFLSSSCRLIAHWAWNKLCVLDSCVSLHVLNAHVKFMNSIKAYDVAIFTPTSFILWTIKWNTSRNLAAIPRYSSNPTCPGYLLRALLPWLSLS